MSDSLQCECRYFAVTNEDEFQEVLYGHHPRCEKYQPAIFFVLEANGTQCIVESRELAHELAESDGCDEYVIRSIRMSRERFDHLPEFQGF